tara:strand:- start:6349 stop:7587 length:1239 start_codon:yes stop_codon:yes gene_type:complete
MLSVNQAQKKILANIKVLATTKTPLLECLNQVLARNIVSTINVPLRNNSSMDGYAIKASDTKNANKKKITLHVIGENQAGRIFKKEIKSGQAVRIMTGSVIPKGANAVVPFEDTDEYAKKNKSNNLPKQVQIYKTVQANENIRKAAEDTKKGAMILKKNTLLNPAHIGLAASVGIEKLPITRKPIIAIISSGNEIIRPPQKIKPGQVYDSNTYSIASQVKQLGGVPKIYNIARDTIKNIQIKLDHASKDSDLIISTAGVSKGDYDLFKEVVTLNGKIDFWSIKMKPGKPLMFGMIRQNNKQIPHIGLPGNPVSAMVTFELFARPAILKMMNKNFKNRESIQAILNSDIINSDKREVYARVQLSSRNNQIFATITGNQGSGILQSMSLADGLVKCPATKKTLKKGSLVQVITL